MINFFSFVRSSLAFTFFLCFNLFHDFFRSSTMQKKISFNFVSRFRSPSEHWAHMKAVKNLISTIIWLNIFLNIFFIYFFSASLFLSLCCVFFYIFAVLEKLFFFIYSRPKVFPHSLCFVSLHWNRLESANSECSFGELFLTNLIIKRQFKIIKIMGAITFALIAQNYIAKWLIFCALLKWSLSGRVDFVMFLFIFRCRPFIFSFFFRSKSSV